MPCGQTKRYPEHIEQFKKEFTEVNIEREFGGLHQNGGGHIKCKEHRPLGIHMGIAHLGC